MILELNDIEIILRKASDEEKQSIPVWDAYIEKVIIDGNIPSLLRDKLTGKINNLTQGFTQKFSGQLKGNIENEILSLEEYVYRKHDLTFTKLRVVREHYSLRITTAKLLFLGGSFVFVSEYKEPSILR